MNKPLILITNDDGLGIRFLIDIMKDYGDIVVDSKWPKIRISHAISLESIITCRNISVKNIAEYVSSGTPVDC